MPDQSHRRRSKSRPSPYVLQRINPDAAGIDCGATAHFVAVPPDRDTTPSAIFSDVYGRPASPGRLARGLSGDQRGAGSHGRVLDSRCTRSLTRGALTSTWSMRDMSRRRARAEERCLRLPSGSRDLHSVGLLARELSSG